MSYGTTLDKNRLYFTQNNTPIRLRCPACVLNNKSIRHCKIYKNLPALWCHLKKYHDKIAYRQFNTEDVIQLLNSISKAIELKIIPESKQFEEKPIAATTSSILINGKVPRKDVQENLKKISELLVTQSEHFPKFKHKLLSVLIEKAIGVKDHRIHKKYLNCIMGYSEKDKIHGMYDVRKFCEELGDYFE